MRRVAAAAVAILLLGACSEQSNVAPDAAITVHGSVGDVGGAPLSDRPVQLGSGVSDLEGGAGFLTAGLFCLSGACSGDRFDTTTGADGSYAFELSGSDTQSTFGEAVSFLLTTSAAPEGDHPSGPGISARFRIQATDLALPALALIEPGLRLADRYPRAVATWDGAAAPGPYGLAFATTDGRPVWEVETAKAEANLDGRVLEDTTGVALVSGSRKDAIEGSDLTVTWRSSSLAFAGGLGAPPSRGSACTALAEGGTQRELDGCPLTDGSFGPAGLPSQVCPEGQTTTACPATTGVRVELPDAVAADLLVVRGCVEACRVAVVPAGGGTASDVGSVTGPYVAKGLPGAPISAVELTAADLSTLAEVSIWAPVTEADRQTLLPVDDPPVLDGSGADDDRDRRLVAALAAGALLLGAVVLLVRNRARLTA